jgi:cbb3-type cytochrome oxidase maturation protein
VNEPTIALLVMSLLIFAIMIGFFIWAIKSGQFKNVEEAKYQVFRRQEKSTEKKPGNSRKKGDKA